MKRHIYKISAAIMMSVVLALAVSALTSCRRTSHNGLIDGHWRVDRVEYFEAGQPEQSYTPDRYFIAINLELLHLIRPSGGMITGVISYDKKAETLGVDFPYNNSPAVLREFGILDNPVTFRVKTLTGSRMVLESKATRVICTRF